MWSVSILNLALGGIRDLGCYLGQLHTSVQDTKEHAKTEKRTHKNLPFFCETCHWPEIKTNFNYYQCIDLPSWLLSVFHWRYLNWFLCLCHYGGLFEKRRGRIPNKHFVKFKGNFPELKPFIILLLQLFVLRKGWCRLWEGLLRGECRCGSSCTKWDLGVAVTQSGN